MLPGRNSETKPCRTIDSIDICIKYCRLMIHVPMKMAINLGSPAQITSQRRAFSGALWWCMCGIARTETTETGWFLVSKVNQHFGHQIYQWSQHLFHQLDSSRCIQMYPGLLSPGSSAPAECCETWGHPMFQSMLQSRCFAEIPLKTDQKHSKLPCLGLIHIMAAAFVL